MSRTLAALAALATSAAALAAVHAAAMPAQRVVTIGETGKPLLLARMVVTATPLSEGPSQ